MTTRQKSKNKHSSESDSDSHSDDNQGCCPTDAQFCTLQYVCYTFKLRVSLPNDDDRMREVRKVKVCIQKKGPQVNEKVLDYMSKNGSPPCDKPVLKELFEGFTKLIVERWNNREDGDYTFSSFTCYLLNQLKEYLNKWDTYFAAQSVIAYSREGYEFTTESE